VKSPPRVVPLHCSASRRRFARLRGFGPLRGFVCPLPLWRSAARVLSVCFGAMIRRSMRPNCAARLRSVCCVVEIRFPVPRSPSLRRLPVLAATLRCFISFGSQAGTLRRRTRMAPSLSEGHKLISGCIRSQNSPAASKNQRKLSKSRIMRLHPPSSMSEGTKPLPRRSAMSHSVNSASRPVPNTSQPMRLRFAPL